MAWIGVGYRPQLRSWIKTNPVELECLEVTAEHFFGGEQEILEELRQRYPIFVHGLGLSIGTPGPLDQDLLNSFVDVVDVVNPEWVSEHIAFTRSSEVDLGHLNPVIPSKKVLEWVVSHSREIADRCQKPVILENITTNLKLKGDYSETDFMNRICDEADCGLLLDVTNLYINSRNHGFDPERWLAELDPSRIIQLHVVGYEERSGRLVDTHRNDIQDDLMSLIQCVLRQSSVRAVTIERDANFSGFGFLGKELRKLKDLMLVQ